MAETNKDNNKLENFYQVPKSLFQLLIDKEITLTAYKIFVIMWERYRLSLENGEKFRDRDGKTYIAFSYDEIMAVLKIKSRTPISKAIKELERLNLIIKKRQFNKSSRYYFNSTPYYTSILNNTSTLNCTNTSTLTTDTNKNNSNKNNSSNNNIVVLSKVAKNEGTYFLTIKNYLSGLDLNYKSVGKMGKPLPRIKEVIDFAKRNGKNEGWIYKAIKEDWDLKEKKKKNIEIGKEDHEASEETMAIYEALGIKEGGKQ